MDDYISRKTAIDEFDGVKVDEENCTEYDIGYNDGIDFAVSRLSVLPSADVQPVVRCKNCKYWDESDIHSTIYSNCRCRATVAKIYTDAEFYCAYYKRKDGEQSGTD